MKTFKYFINLLTIISFFIATAVSAHTSPDKNEQAKLSTILKKLSDEGYTTIQDVELEDNVLTVEGVNKEGTPFKVQLDPKTGNILKQKQIQPKYSIIEVVKKVEGAGNLQIVEVEFDEGIYKVKALTPDQKEKELRIDPQTGDIKAENNKH
ncbi:PepSY domain-containing protein [Legionella yabuuchiae]|uniref:PepSY domain-containing protein n=1 Tax=Legionella yabuuchiae TaxID=376727 RepID=UPI001055B631|nr:PepSY domain-containing protein [Legionella yabuuchiae]